VPENVAFIVPLEKAVGRLGRVNPWLTFLCQTGCR
jgi:hypothetical protein